MVLVENPQIPGTSKPLICKQPVDDGKCGKEANHTVSFQTEVFGKLINVKVPFCDEHLNKLNIKMKEEE